jgi:hypothetical protein
MNLFKEWERMLSIWEKALMSKIELILGITIPALYTKIN